MVKKQRARPITGPYEPLSQSAVEVAAEPLRTTPVLGMNSGGTLWQWSRQDAELAELRTAL